MSVLVLVGMSVADVDRRDELVSAAAALDADVAFLQQGDPSLASTLTRLADAGAEEIRLLGISFGGPLAPAMSWLRRVAGYWWRERAGQRPDVAVASRLCESLDPDLLTSTLEHTRPITGTEPGMTSAAWEDVSAHRHQVMVCRGPRCTAKGGEESLRGLILGMLENQLGDDDVLLVHTGCQFPCNQAPVISVQPDDVWYGHVDAVSAAAIVSEHLVGGRPYEPRRLPRHAGPTAGS